MIVKIYNIPQDKTEVYHGSSPEILTKLQYRFPFLSKINGLGQAIARLNRMQNYLAEVTDKSLLKTESSLNSYTIRSQLGFNPLDLPEFHAAKFLSGKPDPQKNKAVEALRTNDGEVERAALFAYGMNVTDENIQAIKNLTNSKYSLSNKDQGETSKSSETPEIHYLHDGDEQYAAILHQAFENGLVNPISLNGKHSKGAMTVRDDENKMTWLLKPDSGGLSSILGEAQEMASAPMKEGAFYQVSKLLDLDHYFLKAVPIKINEVDYSMEPLLSHEYSTLADRMKGDPSFGSRCMQLPLSNGNLHKLSALFFILGDFDGHLQNILVNAEGRFYLIDHGAAFPGDKGIHPGKDPSAYVPSFLTVFSGKNFKNLSDTDKLRLLPRVPKNEEDLVRNWLLNIDEHKVEETLQLFGVNPGPSLERLNILKERAKMLPISDALNTAWVN